MKTAARLMIAASLSLALMSIEVKSLSSSIGTNEIVFLRSLVHLAVLVPILINLRVSLPAEFNRLLLLRGALGYVGVLCLFVSLKSLPVGFAILIAWTSPLFTVLFSSLLARERPAATFLVALGVAAAGLAVFAAPGAGAPGSGFTEGVRASSLLIGLVGAMSAGASYALLKRAGSSASPHTVAFFFSLVALMASAPQALAHVQVPQFSQWLPIAAVGSCAAFYQYAVARAYQLAPAAAVAPFSLLTPVFGAGLDWVFFGTSLFGHQLVGAGIILVGLVLAQARPAPKQAN
ncbi:MAG: DMT family transporter [Deltaproteobacteria bacterium]|nr:DMT family transporter [Deltaproteobacteria bacterium]